MNVFSWIFRGRTNGKKSASFWQLELADRPDWMLENIVKNPGEFTVEMRAAASEILVQRNSRS